MGLASPTHLIILLVILLLLFGAKKIPELAKGLGQGMKEFKKGQNDDEVESNDTRSRSVEGERAEAPRAEVHTEESSKNADRVQ